MRESTVYLSLGSNLGDRAASLEEALRQLHAPEFMITRLSSVWETAPMYNTDQPDFLNLVAEARTTLTPEKTLERTAAVEKKMGRQRLIANGPRPIDIDILLFDSVVLNLPNLGIPHGRMTERRFVLEPLNELAPGLRHPVDGRTVRELLNAAPDQLVSRNGLRLAVPGAAAEV